MQCNRFQFKLGLQKNRNWNKLSSVHWDKHLFRKFSQFSALMNRTRIFLLYYDSGCKQLLFKKERIIKTIFLAQFCLTLMHLFPDIKKRFNHNKNIKKHQFDKHQQEKPWKTLSQRKTLINIDGKKTWIKL